MASDLMEREIVEEVIEQTTDNGDHDLFAHYVNKSKIVDSAVFGTPVTALCGKVWVPGRDPQKFPVCPACKDVYDGLTDDGGEE